MLFTLHAGDVPLTITSGLTTVDLGTFDTTGFADGADTITVTVDRSVEPGAGVRHGPRERVHRAAGDANPVGQPEYAADRDVDRHQYAAAQ